MGASRTTWGPSTNAAQATSGSRSGSARGARYWRGYATFAEADRARTKIAADIAAGKIGLEVEKDPVPSLGELFEASHKRRVKTHRSAKEDRWRWDRHLATWLKNLRPEEDGRPIEMLKEILGHSMVQVTERYAHLRMDLFRPEDLAAMTVDLSPAEARTGAFGYAVATQEVDARAAKP